MGEASALGWGTKRHAFKSHLFPLLAGPRDMLSAPSCSPRPRKGNNPHSQLNGLQGVLTEVKERTNSWWVLTAYLLCACVCYTYKHTHTTTRREPTPSQPLTSLCSSAQQSGSQCSVTMTVAGVPATTTIIRDAHHLSSAVFDTLKLVHLLPVTPSGA